MSNSAVKLRCVIKNVESETRQLIEQVLDLETASMSDEAGQKDMARLQNFDLTIQSLQAISLFLNELSVTIPDEYELDITSALQKIHLGAMVARLEGRLENQQDVMSHSNGTIELF